VSLDECDRFARGYERAVLAYSLTGGTREPILLDRTLSSLTGLRRYCAECPDTDPAPYLAMTALTVLGRDTDLAAMPEDIDAFERWVASQPPAGPPWRRPRTHALRLRISPADVDQLREIVHLVLPALRGGEESSDDDRADDEPWSWSLFVDPDELRADAEDESVTLTSTDDDLLRQYTVIANVWGTSPFAVSYDIDEVASVRYLLHGLAGGLPGYLFGGKELAQAPGAVFIPLDDWEAYRVPLTPQLVTALGLSPEWPHER
jgi:hypothetical protein